MNQADTTAETDLDPATGEDSDAPTRSANNPSPVPRDSGHESQGTEEADEPAEGQADEHEDAAGQPPERRRRAPRTRRALRRIARPSVLLPLLLICALLAGVAVLGVQSLKDSALHDARASAVKAARDYAVALTTYDHKTLNDDFAKVSSNATGQFAKEYEQVSANLTQLIKKHKSVSKGKVTAAGLVSGDQDRAVVLLFVDQTITNANIDKPRIDRNRMRMTLLHNDDRWLIDNVKLL